MNISSLFDNLSTKLGLVKEKLLIENSTNDYSLNIKLENTFIKILNILYETNINNANEIKANFPGIDAIDEGSKTIYQITSTFSKEKIVSTLKTCIKHDIHETYPTLKFLFLKDIKNLSKKSILEIEKISNDKFNLNFEKDFIDSNQIYQRLFFDQDIDKTLEIIKLLDNLLGTLPLNKISSFASIAISFESDEDNNTYNLIDSVLKQGINVFISSKKIYDTFITNEHRFAEYLILIHDLKELSHIKNYIVVLSKRYIDYNLKGSVNCVLLKNLLQHDFNSKVVCFNPYIDNIKDIVINGFRSPSTLSKDKEKLYKFSSELLQNVFNSNNVDIDYSIDDIINELQSIYPNFNFNIVHENNHYKTIRFFVNGMDLEMIYIILKNNYVLKPVVDQIESVLSLNKNINILVPKKLHNKTRKQIENLKARTEVKNIFFIDEFLFDRSLKKINQNKILNINDFVDPIIKRNGETIHMPDIINWIVEERYPSIAIIKASGGIGKTTLSEKIHDLLIQDEENNFLVLFIDSSSFIQNFRHTDFNEEGDYDLFNIYKKCHPQGDKIDEITFNNNYSHGNILMIIDGVDEVVSTISSFSLDSFLHRLLLLNKKIGKGKILLTSRDIYINDIKTFLTENTKSDNRIVIYDLLPFNETLARQYFSKHLTSKNKIEKCIDLLNEFIIDSLDRNYKYPPFVLEVVLDFILNNDFENPIDTIFNSEYLLEFHSSDFIIHQTFKREILRKEEHGYDLSIDGQVIFFSIMALEKNGVIDRSDFPDMLNRIGHMSRLNETASAMIDHPFLKKHDGCFYFNFKFLKGEFLIIPIYNLLKERGFVRLENHVIDLLANKCNFNSIVSKGILTKVKLDSFFDDAIFLSSIKGLIRNIRESDCPKISKRKAISNLFLIFCEYCQNEKIILENKGLNIISSIFSSNNDEFISHFYLFDVPEDMHLKLDFSNLYFQDSHISNYSGFLNCNFDLHTAFVDSCVIDKINMPSNFDLEKVTLSKENFHNIQGDNSIHKILRILEEGVSGIENDIREFLKCFYVNRNLNVEIPKRIVKSSMNNSAKERIISEALFAEKILTDISNSHYSLNKELISKINKFTYQGRNFLQINRAYKLILAQY